MPPCSAGSKGFSSVRIPQSRIRSGCARLPGMHAVKPKQADSHGLISRTCAEIVLSVRKLSSARLPEALSALAITPRPRAGASFLPTISMPSAFIPFLGEASRRVRTSAATPILSSSSATSCGVIDIKEIRKSLAKCSALIMCRTPSSALRQRDFVGPSWAGRLEASCPATNRGRSIGIWPLWQTPFNHARTMLPTLEVMVGVVAFVLLIACANVGNLLLVRSFTRRHEMSVRLAIGASRVRLVKQLLTEGLILSALGTAGGLLVAYWCRHALVLLLPTRSGVAMYLPGQMDARVMAMSAGVGLLVTLMVGIIPAFQTRHLDLAGPLKADSSGVVGARGRAWMRSGLVVFQVSLSFILLVGAALLLESLEKIRSASPGFTTTSVVTTGVSLEAAGYDVPRAKIFQDELIDRLSALPGVESAAFACVTPLGYATYSSTPIVVNGYQPSLEEQPSVEYNQVGPGYFATLGIPLFSGRAFARTDDENAPLVAIVNRTMVTRYWAGEDPVGRRLQVKGRWARVVGVVADSKYESMRETPRPFFYVPLRQDFVRGPALNIRTSQSLSSVRAALVREVHALDANLALYELITLQEQVNRSTSPQLVAVTLVSILGGLALLLAGVGLYGVMSYAVAQSTRELGLRMALGAGAANLLRLVISRGLRLTAGGVLFGTVAALAVTRLLGQLLYNVSPHDPVVFGLALAVMTTTAIFACILPAWRASRTDPARVLRD